MSISGVPGRIIEMPESAVQANRDINGIWQNTDDPFLVYDTDPGYYGSGCTCHSLEYVARVIADINIIESRFNAVNYFHNMQNEAILAGGAIRKKNNYTKYMNPFHLKDPKWGWYTSIAMQLSEKQVDERTRDHSFLDNLKILSTDQRYNFALIITNGKTVSVVKLKHNIVLLDTHQRRVHYGTPDFLSEKIREIAQNSLDGEIYFGFLSQEEAQKNLGKAPSAPSAAPNPPVTVPPSVPSAAPKPPVTVPPSAPSAAPKAPETVTPKAPSAPAAAPKPPETVPTKPPISPTKPEPTHKKGMLSTLWAAITTFFAPLFHFLASIPNRLSSLFTS